MLGRTSISLSCVLSHFSYVRLFATLLTAALQASLSMGFFRQKYLSGLPCCPSGDLPDPGIERTSLSSPCIVRWVLYHQCHLGSPSISLDHWTNQTPSVAKDQNSAQDSLYKRENYMDIVSSSSSPSSSFSFSSFSSSFFCFSFPPLPGPLPPLPYLQ